MRWPKVSRFSSRSSPSASVIVLMAISIALATSSCGGRQGATEHAPVMKPVRTIEPLASYNLDDEACQPLADTVSLTKARVWTWELDHVVPRSVDLHDVQTTTSLTSLAVSKTVFKETYERVCDFNKGQGHLCDDSRGREKGWVQRDDSVPLRVCRDGFPYARSSYEGVALSSLYYLQIANDAYRRLAVQDGAKAPVAVELKVLPEFIDYYDNYTGRGQPERIKTYQVHNLAYFPSRQMIAVFPESEQRSQKEQGFFWESEFVLGHEYGHHIDFTRHGRVLTSVGLTWSPNIHGFIDTQALASTGDGATDRAQIAGALSEAFADMLAFYAEGGTSQSLSGLPDIGFNRNPLNAAFANGDGKILTEDRLEQVLTKAGPGSQNGAPDYTDIHVIGAILGYTLNKTFDTLQAARNAESTTLDANAKRLEMDRRYRMLLSFMDEVVTKFEALAATDEGASVTTPISAGLEKVTEDYLADLSLTDGDAAAEAVKTEVCKSVRAQLPALQAIPFEKVGNGASGSGC